MATFCALWHGAGLEHVFIVCHHPVHQVALQHANGHGIALFTPDAGTLTLKFVGADPGTDCGYGIGLPVLPVSFFKFPLA